MNRQNGQNEEDRTERRTPQQLPNMDSSGNTTNEAQGRGWAGSDWGGYINWTMPMRYWGNFPKTQGKGLRKGRNDSRME